MRGSFWLSDRQWAAIEPHLPYYAAGKRREDDRRIISGTLHVSSQAAGGGTVRRNTGLRRRSTIAITAGRNAVTGSTCSRL